LASPIKQGNAEYYRSQEQFCVQMANAVQAQDRWLKVAQECREIAERADKQGLRRPQVIGCLPSLNGRLRLAGSSFFCNVRAADRGQRHVASGLPEARAATM